MGLSAAPALDRRLSSLYLPLQAFRRLSQFQGSRRGYSLCWTIGWLDRE